MENLDQEKIQSLSKSNANNTLSKLINKFTNINRNTERIDSYFSRPCYSSESIGEANLIIRELLSRKAFMSGMKTGIPSGIYSSKLSTENLLDVAMSKNGITVIFYINPSTISAITLNIPEDSIIDSITLNAMILNSIEEYIFVNNKKPIKINSNISYC